MPIERSVEITPTSIELAHEFCGLDSDNQAEFFNHVARVTDVWEMPFCFQLQYVTDAVHLTDGAREIMHQIGEYAYRIEATPICTRLSFDQAWSDAHRLNFNEAWEDSHRDAA